MSWISCSRHVMPLVIDDHHVYLLLTAMLGWCNTCMLTIYVALCISKCLFIDSIDFSYFWKIWNIHMLCMVVFDISFLEDGSMLLVPLEGRFYIWFICGISVVIYANNQARAIYHNACLLHVSTHHASGSCHVQHMYKSTYSITIWWIPYVRTCFPKWRLWNSTLYIASK